MVEGCSVKAAFGPNMRLRPELLIVSLVVSPLMAEWPQWRGPDRNGVSADTTAIVESLPPEGFKQVWESGFIPSDHYGGHASPVVAHERVFLSLVWHERVPSEQRVLDQETMQKFNHRGLPAELSAKMEAAREGMSGRMRGEKLDAFIEQWNKENLSAEQQISLGSWVASRFRAGKTAVPMKWLDKVAAKADKPFESAAALKAWLDEEQFPADIAQKVIDTVPNTVMTAKDAVLCLDATSGKELWKFTAEAAPAGRKASSTCAVVAGKVYAMGGASLYCLEMESGKQVWSAKLPGKAPGSSPLVVDGVVYVTAGQTAAYSAADGKELWSQKAAKSDVASPTWWALPKPLLVVQTNNKVLGLSPADGSIMWEVEGGAQSSPVTHEDWLVIYSGTKDVGLRAYQANADGSAPKAVWSHFWLTRRYTGTPIIHEGLVYAMCGEKHLCVELSTGKIRWEEKVNSTISSPLLVDGKLLVQENNGSHIRLVKADASSYQMLSRAKADAMSCATPAVSNGKLLVRQKEKLVCFDLRVGK
jgi:outer membrane protein assembly factor BamB